jgi:hypothetical protein
MQSSSFTEQTVIAKVKLKQLEREVFHVLHSVITNIPFSELPFLNFDK